MASQPQSSEKQNIVRTYVILAVALCAITFVEWVIFKIETIRTQAIIMVPLLLILSVVKFVMVAGWYMHLRFDHRFLWRMFAITMFLVVAVFLAMMVTL